VGIYTLLIALGKNLKGLNVSPKEYTLLSKDGREIFGIHATRLIDFEGENAILDIITDITERKQAEEKLKNKVDELEKWQKLTVGRETKMAELKKKIQELEKEIKDWQKRLH
jgi:predicted RNase H-like nuclease (RuvC/YqgF family)